MAPAFFSHRLAAFKAALPGKGKAVAIHLSISLAIFLVLLYLIIFKWYPVPYFSTDGGWQGIRIMFGVDVVLGPVLTFVIFNAAKPRKEIITDLSLVALIQLSALAWGVSTVYGQRPVAIVAFDGVFYSVTPDLYAQRNIDLESLKRFDSRQPPVIYQRVPEGEEAVKSFRLSVEWPRRAQDFLYARFDENLPAVFRAAAEFESRVLDMYPDLQKQFDAMRAKYGQDVGFLPFSGRYREVIVVVNRRGDLVDSFGRRKDP